ncbi:sugar transporter [Pseudoflavitalea sp. G-6-1-2]|uniref:protein-disulfide reductase DsbD domain-containing protein n=1 Tax=Pseudoflavitalea sp. G-6-1-2 TaxID=2728841 RepID=UPI00146A37AF|nr:protein-disulfide reductase DsbD domain-containing protein [Pseudoflavitalea sp. G-6-1-2]NML20778.1 sugar transporter [Pseudoflavitalea sp. G-6-1-2]
MKKFLLLGIVALIGSVAMAQSSKAVKWTFSSKKIAAGTYEVRMSAAISGDYHMYAQNAGVDGPLPTAISFNKNPLVTVDGKAKEVGKMVKKFESAWSGTVNYYEKTVDFVQVVKVKGKAKTNVSGKVEFMVCNDEQCLPPSEEEFTVNIGG